MVCLQGKTPPIQIRMQLLNCQRNGEALLDCTVIYLSREEYSAQKNDRVVCATVIFSTSTAATP